MTMTRQGKHHTLRSDLTGLTVLIITTKQSVTFYGKMYGKVQYRTPIPSHVPVKVNTVTCAGKGFVTPNKHDELPHSFYSTTDNNNYQQWYSPIKLRKIRMIFDVENQILAFFDVYFWPFNKSHEKINAIFVASIWNVFIKFHWHDEKFTSRTSFVNLQSLVEDKTMTKTRQIIALDIFLVF